MATTVQEFYKKNPNYVGRAYHPPAPPKQRGKGGWLSSIISELSGAGGAAGGAAAGAAAGSVVPGIGTLLGGIGGGIVGGFAGGFGGRAVENKVRDDEWRLRQAAGEGLLSGALGGAGTAFQAARGLKAVGGMRGLQAVAGGSDDALKLASKAILKGGKKAGTSISGGFDDLAKAARQTAGRNTAERSGNAMYRSTLGIDDIVMPNQTKPTTLFKADELVKEARRIGLKGSPTQMQRQMGVAYERFNTKVAGELAKSKGTVAYKRLAQDSLDDVAKKLPLKVEGQAVRSELERSLKNVLAPLAKKGRLDATAIHTFKNSLPVDSAFKKIALGTNLTAKETVDLALWSQADDWLTKVAPAAKELTKRQSNLYGLAQGLGRMTRTPGDPKSMVDLGARILSPTVRKAQNATGRALLAGGGAEAAIPGQSLARELVPKMASRGVANNMFMPAPPAEEPAPQPDTTLYGPQALQSAIQGGMGGPATEAPPQYTLQQALQEAQQLLGPDATAPQYLSYAKAIMDSSEGPKMSAQEKKAAKQAETALQGLNQLRSLYSSAGGGQNRLPGILSNVEGLLGTNSKAESYNKIRDSLTTSLARAFGETGVLTDQDREVYKQALPRLQDTPEEAAIKLQYLEDMLSGAMVGGSGQTFQDPYSEYSGLAEAF